MEKLLDPPDVKMKSGTPLMLSKSRAIAQASTPYKRSVLKKRQLFKELPTVLEDNNRIVNMRDRKTAIERVRHKNIKELKSRFANKRSDLIGTLQQRKLVRDQAELDKIDEENFVGYVTRTLAILSIILFMCHRLSLICQLQQRIWHPV
jgi:hypothetical protein